MAGGWDERWAELCIAAATGADVRQHDDGSADAMFDLAIYDARARLVGAVEVTSVIDERQEASRAALYAKGDGGIRMLPGLTQAWAVEITAGANQKAVWASLPGHLAQLEELGLDWVRVDDWSVGFHHPDVKSRMTTLGVRDSMRFGGSPGQVYVEVDSSAGGAVNSTGEGVVDWLYEELARRPGDLAKVDQDVAQREVFLIARHGVPWEVGSYLEWWTRAEAALPPEPARLPTPLTGVWLLSSFSEMGVRWDGRSWSFFETRTPEIHAALEAFRR